MLELELKIKSQIEQFVFFEIRKLKKIYNEYVREHFQGNYSGTVDSTSVVIQNILRFVFAGWHYPPSDLKVINTVLSSSENLLKLAYECPEIFYPEISVGQKSEVTTYYRALIDRFIANPVLSFSQINSNPTATFGFFVKGLMGEDIDVRGAPMDTIEDIKYQIQDAQGIPPDQQRLILNGRQWADEQTLSEAGVGPNSCMHLVLRLSGD